MYGVEIPTKDNTAQHSQAPANRAVAACLQESRLVSHPATLNYQGAEEPPRLISDRPLAGNSLWVSGTKYILLQFVAIFVVSLID